MPLTLLRLSAEHRSAVIEIGANRPGEVADLVRIARPDVGLITNAGAEHLEGFGDLDGVARAEGEMVAGLDADDIAVINADDAYAGAVARHDPRARGDLRRRPPRRTSSASDVRERPDGRRAFASPSSCARRRASASCG